MASAKGLVWHEAKTVNGETGVNALDCPTAGLCIAAGYSSVSVSRSPSGGKRTWKRQYVDRTLDSNGMENSITAVGCVSASACVVGDDDQNGWFSSSPASGGWDAFGFPYDTYVTVEAIGCSHLGNCTALSVDDHAMSTPSLSATSSWSFVQLPGTNSNGGGSTEIADVSCPGRLCAIVDSGSDVYVTTDAGVSWKAVHIKGAQQITSVDCVSARFCIAAASYGHHHVWISRNPTVASSWHVIAKFNGAPGTDYSVGCVNAGRCVVSGAAVYSSTNATRPGSWVRDRVPGGYGVLDGISCPSTSLCAMTDQFGDIYTARF